MTKYDTDFKLRAVHAYLAQDNGDYKAVGQAFGVNASMLQRWVLAYRVHGESALQKKFSHYSAEFKLFVLERVQRGELSRSQAAALYDLRGGSWAISLWQRRYDAGGVDALQAKPKGRQEKQMKKPEKTPLELNSPIGTDDPRTLKDVLKENAYLRAEVAYLKKLRALIQEEEKAAQKKRG